MANIEQILKQPRYSDFIKRLEQIDTQAYYIEFKKQDKANLFDD
jgi:hypothetical protein